MEVINRNLIPQPTNMKEMDANSAPLPRTTMEAMDKNLTPQPRMTMEGMDKNLTSQPRMTMEEMDRNLTPQSGMTLYGNLTGQPRMTIEEMDENLSPLSRMTMEKINGNLTPPRKMTMEKMDENVTLQLSMKEKQMQKNIIHEPNEAPELLPTDNECQPSWKDESVACFVCNICKKSFYNVNALQNHKNLQHDGEGSSSDGENYPSVKLFPNDQNFNGISGYKFIPRKDMRTPDMTSQDHGLTTRSFSVDTTYLIVKVEDKVVDVDAVKRSRLEGVVKRTQMKPGGKQSIDLQGPFTCTFPSTLRAEMQCRQIFFNCCEYSLHYREDHTKRRKAALRCQVCEKRLDGDLYQGNPLAPQIHTPSNFNFSCRMCRQTFMSSTDYDEHVRMIHAKMKPHQCTICAKRFTQQGGLQQHMRMHTGIRPFPCTFCPKAFTQKAGLDQHLRTHTKVKPFKCVICSKCFSQSVHLRQHMRTHTNIQPFECSYCGKRFKQSSHLNFHLRSHIGIEDPSLMDQYAQAPRQIDFLNLANLQPVHDGETLYYAAELTTELPQRNSYSFEGQGPITNNVLSL